MSPTSGSLHGACFSFCLCLCLCLSPSLLHASTSIAATLGLCSCSGARHQLRHPQLAPTVMHTLQASPSSCAFVLFEPDHQSPWTQASQGESVQPLESTLTSMAPSVAYRSRLCFVFCLWPAPLHLSAASNPICVPVCLWLNPHHWPPLAATA